MSNITYFASIETMGDNVTEADAEGYREWAKSELEKEFPGVEIEVSSEQKLYSFECDSELDEDYIGQFCKSLWDRCPWTWVDC